MKLRNKLQETFKVVKDQSDISRNKQKEHFDTTANSCKIQIGDKVLVKKLARKERRNLTNLKKLLKKQMLNPHQEI